MITDEERREVANKLRELEVGEFDDGEYYDRGEVEDAIGLFTNDGAWYEASGVRRLADLIEPEREKSGFIVAPGKIIKEYLDARGLTQREVSKRTGVSERHLSCLLNGKTKLTADMALKLEKVLPDVPASFWLTYEVKYQVHLAREREKAYVNEFGRCSSENASFGAM